MLAAVDLACRGEFPEWDASDLPQDVSPSYDETLSDSESKATGFVEADLKIVKPKGKSKYTKLAEEKEMPEVDLNGGDEENFLNEEFSDNDETEGAPLSTLSYSRVAHEGRNN